MWKTRRWTLPVRPATISCRLQVYFATEDREENLEVAFELIECARVSLERHVKETPEDKVRHSLLKGIRVKS